ncbi:hypothetical protein GGE65_004032 [Skermanella aerolata]|uniref:hypothetical protein n=1 Tax=Skermanella aerolata TaxID=393310 RepID=UPI0005E1100E|nr:hypothetical protein [Skermanella aerolata]KJB97228.1 hypothetical protein N826_29970 [Skermanella aerolata KACC 11604]
MAQQKPFIRVDLFGPWNNAHDRSNSPAPGIVPAASAAGSRRALAAYGPGSLLLDRHEKTAALMGVAAEQQGAGDGSRRSPRVRRRTGGRCLGDMMAELLDEMGRRGFNPETAVFSICRQ